MNVPAMYYEFRFDGLTTVMTVLLYVFLAIIFVAMIAVPACILWRLASRAKRGRNKSD